MSLELNMQSSVFLAMRHVALVEHLCYGMFRTRKEPLYLLVALILFIVRMLV
jgi:hypothetical protein